MVIDGIFLVLIISAFLLARTLHASVLCFVLLFFISYYRDEFAAGILHLDLIYNAAPVGRLT